MSSTNPAFKALPSADLEYKFLDGELNCTLIVPIFGRPGMAKEHPEKAKIHYELVDEGTERGFCLTLGWYFPEAGTKATFCHKKSLFGKVVPEDCSWADFPFSRDNLDVILTNGKDLSSRCPKLERETGNNRSLVIQLTKREPGLWPNAFRELESASESQETVKGSEASRETAKPAAAWQAAAPKESVKGTMTPTHKSFSASDNPKFMTVIVPILGRPGVAKALPEKAKVQYELVDDETGSYLSLGWDYPKAGTGLDFFEKEPIFGKVDPEKSFCKVLPLSVDTVINAMQGASQIFVREGLNNDDDDDDLSSFASSFQSEIGNHRTVVIFLVKKEAGPWPSGLFKHPERTLEIRPRKTTNFAAAEKPKDNSNLSPREEILESMAKDFAAAKEREKNSDLSAGLYLQAWDPNSNPFQMVIEESFPTKALFDEIGGPGVSGFLDYENGALMLCTKVFLSSILTTESMKHSSKTIEESKELLRLRLQSIVHPNAPQTEVIELLPVLTVRFFLNYMRPFETEQTMVMTAAEKAENSCESLVGISSFLLTVSSALLKAAQEGSFDFLDDLLACALFTIKDSVTTKNRKENTSEVPDLDGQYLLNHCLRQSKSKSRPKNPSTLLDFLKKQIEIEKELEPNLVGSSRGKNVMISIFKDLIENWDTPDNVDWNSPEYLEGLVNGPSVSEDSQAANLPPKAFPKENASSMIGALKDVSLMSVKEMKKELKSYGITTETFIEKSELVQALENARSAK